MPLQSMAALRELELTLDCPDPWTDLASALERLPGQRLQHLVLRHKVTIVHVPAPSAGAQPQPHKLSGDPVLADPSLSPVVRMQDGEGMEHLEAALTSKHFPRLESVHLRFAAQELAWDPGAVADEIELEVQRRLPTLSARGVLRLACFFSGTALTPAGW